MALTIRSDEIYAFSSARFDSEDVGFWVLTSSERFRADRPVAIPVSQRYYWTEEWQDGEAETLAELERGEGREFGSGREAVEWLHSEED